MKKWPTQKLEQLTTKIGSGATPRGGQNGYVEAGVSLIRSQNILDNGMNIAEIAHITDEAAHKLRGVTVQANDVLINITGDSIARCSIVDERVLPARVNQHVSILRTTAELDPLFLQKFLVTPGTKNLLMAISSGGTRQALTRSDLANLSVPVPPITEQRAIAEVLGALDDKIAANNKIAAISDEFIRTEYQKLLHESFETRIIGDFVEQRRESVNPENVSPTLPYIGLEHIPQRLLWSAEHGMSDEVSSNKSKFMSGDILFGKLRPYFHKVIAATETGICSTDVLVMTPLYDTLTGYILAAVSHDSVIREATASSSGTRMPRTNWKDLSAISIPWPGETKALDFSKTVSALQEHVISSLNENHTLASIRDTLLPQLMSGKIRVREAESVVEDVL